MVTVALERVHVELGGRAVLQDIGVTLEPGCLTGIIGPNGAGKSTLTRAMVGLLPCSRGTIRIDGREIGAMRRQDIARALAYLPQGQDLHWPLSVERLVALGRLPYLGPLSSLTDADEETIIRAMDRADVGHLRHRDATTLSGGERARALLARALAVGASGLVVDEPLASLDPGHQIDVMALLLREARDGALVTTVLHDLTMAARYCDRLLLLHHGTLVADGCPAQVLTPRNLAHVFGIDARVDFSCTPPIVAVLGRSAG